MITCCELMCSAILYSLRLMIVNETKKQHYVTAAWVAFTQLCIAPTLHSVTISYCLSIYTESIIKSTPLFLSFVILNCLCILPNLAVTQESVPMLRVPTYVELVATFLQNLLMFQSSLQHIAM